MHDLVTHIRSGQVRGQEVDQVGRFLGIPYAAAPFGELRFERPRPAAAWTGIRDALQFGPTAPAVPLPGLFMPEVAIDGLDCLNLNVWTPDFTGDAMPVMVWIHGGANVSGSSAQPIFDGTSLARQGVVVVSVNFRLGAEGFALLPGTVANRTLLDQAAALEWVRDNISAFGGDPGNVTVFGTSAGAIAILALMSMHTTLFRRAIVQSATPGAAITAADAAIVTAELARRAGVAPTRAGFSSIEPNVLAGHATQAFLDLSTDQDPARWGETAVSSSMPLLPVIDGDVLSGHPGHLAVGAEVDLMIGSNSDELLSMAGPHATTLTETLFREPLLRIARQRTRPTFVYQFDWPSPLPGVGAAHGLELGFVFGNLGISALEGRRPPKALVKRMQSAWVAFASTGTPGWPAHTAENDHIHFFTDPRA